MFNLFKKKQPQRLINPLVSSHQFSTSTEPPAPLIDFLSMTKEQIDQYNLDEYYRKYYAATTNDQREMYASFIRRLEELMGYESRQKERARIMSEQLALDIARGEQS